MNHDASPQSKNAHQESQHIKYAIPISNQIACYQRVSAVVALPSIMALKRKTGKLPKAMQVCFSSILKSGPAMDHNGRAKRLLSFREWLAMRVAL